MIGEDWQITMHEQIRGTQSRLAPTLFFIILYIIGNMFLMNLLLAILLKNFEESSHASNYNDDEEDLNNEIHANTSLQKLKYVIDESYQNLAVKLRFKQV